MPDDRVIAGKYRLIAKLSEGGMGAVWRAEHLELNCAAAVKLLDSAFTESPEALARFKREAQSAASLRSTNIVQIFDFGIHDGAPYIAMELLRGQSLAERFAKKSPLSPRETAVILTQVAKAVTWAHGMGIVHRDLKPGNIFLSENAGETVVKLVDFGIAKPLQLDLTDAPVTITGSIMGTPQYMSPEQASGRRTVDHRTDIWSFGIVAFECLTGYHAFNAETLGGLLLAICSDPMPIPSDFATVPTGFDEWFARCTHRDPNLRFVSIAEAADVLRFICGLEVTNSGAVPQLYSEPPPKPYTAMTSRATRPFAYSGAGSTTDAPSILTLAESLALPRRHPKWLFFGGVAFAGLLFAAIIAIKGAFTRASPPDAIAVAHPNPGVVPKLEPVQSAAAANLAVLVAAPADATRSQVSSSGVNASAPIGQVAAPNKLTPRHLPSHNIKTESASPFSASSSAAPASSSLPKSVPTPVNSDSVESTFGIRFRHPTVETTP